MTAENCIRESMICERAFARVREVLWDLYASRKVDDKANLEEGAPLDRSYDLLIADLNVLKNKYYREAERLWELAESKNEFDRVGVRLLLDNIIIQAARDYEMALSGSKCDSEVYNIERFADIMGSKITAIMARIKRNHGEFVTVSHRDFPSILAETKKNRALGLDMDQNTHECPNCGGRLYTKKNFDVYRVHCTRCDLSEIVRVDRKKV